VTDTMTASKTKQPIHLKRFHRVDEVVWKICIHVGLPFHFPPSARRALRFDSLPKAANAYYECKVGAMIHGDRLMGG
jgi:hypothetical protein